VLLKDALRNLRFDWQGAGEIEDDVSIPEEINIRPTRLSVESAPEMEPQRGRKPSAPFPFSPPEEISQEQSDARPQGDR
jgi:hypothetical protein